MAIDPQKTALYAEITRRAGLYSQMLTLQRNGADAAQIDLAIAAIGIAEAEIRRMSDEINDSIWYKNYGKVLDGYGEAVGVLRAQAATREHEYGELKTLLEDSVLGLGKIKEEIHTLDTRVDDLWREFERLAARVTKMDGGVSDASK